MKVIELPDGREAEFPDEMDNAQIEQVLQKQFAPAKPRSFTDDLVSQAQQSAAGWKREAGLTARNALTAVTSPVHVGASVLNKALNALGANFETDYSKKFEESLTGLGFPDPQTGIEKFGQEMAKSAPAMALPASVPVQMAGNAAIAAAQAPRGQEGKQVVIGGAAGLVPGATQAVGHLLKKTVGMTTGAGQESVEQAFKAGAEGNPAFVQNMRGEVDPSVVVGQAKNALSNMRQSMYDRYATAKGGWAGDTTPLDFKPIGQAFNEAAKKYSFQGVPQPGVADVQPKVHAALNDWLQRARQDPKFLTVEGLDALKRHLQDLTPDYSNRTGRAFVTDVVDKVKESIVKQRPDYAKAMQGYWQESTQLDEITRSLSLGDKATVDTALRKLLSLTRNNANTNYGQRIKSAEALAAQGGEDIMPAVAGQAMNSWAPRGFQGALAGTGGPIAALINPKALLMAPAFSPRLVGKVAHGLGQKWGNPKIRMTIEALRQSGPTTARLTAEELEAIASGGE